VYQAWRKGGRRAGGGGRGYTHVVPFFVGPETDPYSYEITDVAVVQTWDTENVGAGCLEQEHEQERWCPHRRGRGPPLRRERTWRIQTIRQSTVLQWQGTGESREQCRLTVQYRPFRLVVDLPVILLSPSAPSRRRTFNERPRPESSSRNTHPQLGKRHPDVLLEPLRELPSGPRVQCATRTCFSAVYSTHNGQAAFGPPHPQALAKRSPALALSRISSRFMRS
jgi:hypothetical protein